MKHNIFFNKKQDVEFLYIFPTIKLSNTTFVATQTKQTQNEKPHYKPT